MPKHIDRDFRERYRQRQGGQTERSGATAGESLRHGRDKVSGLQDMPYCNKMRNLQAYLTLQASPLHVQVYLTMPGTGRNDSHMPIFTETFLRHGLLCQWMTLAAQAYVPMLE